MTNTEQKELEVFISQQMTTLEPPRFRGAPQVSEKPILFSSPMVRAILEGRKTQTRRVLKNPLDYGCQIPVDSATIHPFGNRLWVRETFSISSNGYFYRADVKQPETIKYSWRPSIFMPRKASRITLEVLSVRIERLQNISSMDVIQEGIQSGPAKHWYHAPDGTEKYRALWDSLNKKRGFGWETNPFVWVIQFRKI